jgi:outer membrane protein OmpA-like peptidoglycan-associated protein
MRFKVAHLGLLGALSVTVSSRAQQPYPPPTAPTPAQPGAAQPAAPPPEQPVPPGAPAPVAPVPGATPYAGEPPLPAPAAEPAAAEPAPGAVQAEFGGQAAYGAETGAGADADAEALTPEQQSELDQASRQRSLKIHNSMYGSSGLYRLREAGSGTPGTFRVSFIGSYFSSTGFLCDGSESSCPNPEGGAPAKDEVSRTASRLGLSATLFEFMEMYLGIHTHATSNSQGDPRLLQVLGDTDLGLKAFLPRPVDSIFSVGGELELWLLNGTGGVGINGSGTSFALRLLSTLDPSNRSQESDVVPIKAHANLGWLFDNSGRLVEKIEADRGDQPITRIERFGLDISRVDSFEVALGLEGTFGVIHPFLEWSVDIPVQRQEYVCNLSRRYPGDDCLGEHKEFGYIPSRLGLGARLFPGIDGLALMAGFEIATGGSSKFLEEVTPEPPWNLYFGLGFAADTTPAPPVIERVEAETPPPPPPPPKRYISGIVVEKGSATPVPDAIVRYEGAGYTGMVTNQDGTFLTVDLAPGTYTFKVSAEGYKDGQCSATVPAAMAGPGPAQYGAPGTEYGAPGTQYGAPGTEYGVPGTEYGVPGAEYGVPGTEYGAPEQPAPAAPPPELPMTRAAMIVAQVGMPPPQPSMPAAQPGAPAPQPAMPAAQPPMPAAQPGMPPAQPGMEGQPPVAGAGPAVAGATQDVVVQLQCELEALPKVGNVVGTTVDAATGAPVSGAKIRITDRLGRFLELNADASGAFRFENVPPGMVKLQVQAEGYLPSVTTIDVEPRKDVRTTLSVNRQPEIPNVVVTAREVKLKKQVHFQHDSAEILPDSMAILQEAADVLRKRTDIALVEIQGHTDNTGTPAYNKRLSQERAEAVREALVELGVEESRLDAKGYGQERPLVPNISDANRAKNRRVQLIIRQRG